jgi:hypothetical protein
MIDPFGTEELRRAVLASWADSPTRFREDANAEEDLLLGGYADRWFVELAQNAADAAQRVGELGRLWVRVVEGELRIANTGAPLDAAGVTALASLRASTKRASESGSDVVGRFGVGFAAVLGVSDAPRIVSTTGGVLFSAERTREQVRALGGVAEKELRTRDDRPPVLRLCWPVAPEEPPIPAGWSTEVRLPLPSGAGQSYLTSAAEAADDLLLALPRLGEITVSDANGSVTHRRVNHPDGTVTFEPGGARWLLARTTGRLEAQTAEPDARLASFAAGLDARLASFAAGLDARLASFAAGPDARLASFAAEDRRDWSVCWALPLAADGRPQPVHDDVLHAPTPSDERLSLPARLCATMPMQPTRRRVRTDGTADAVLRAAAATYPELLRALPPEHRIAAIPRPGFPASEVDERLRGWVTEQLTTTPWLPAQDGGEVAPRDAVLGELAGIGELLADVVPGLIAEQALADVASDPTARAALTALGVRPLGAGALVEQLAQIDRPPTWWRQLYDRIEAIAQESPSVRAELAALPVALADGRTVTGPRTALVLTELSGELLHELGEELRLPGLRVVHPDAAHPLLRLLGAHDADAAELLDHPSLREAVDRSVADAEDGLDTRPLARLVLGLLAAINADTDTLATRPWLAGLALPDNEGQPCRGDELVLPDAVIRPLLAPDAPLGVLADEVVAAHPRVLLTAVGVMDAFAVLVDENPTGPDHDLADEELWWDTLDEPPTRLVALRDLDLVDDNSWPAALAVLAADPRCRAALRSAPRGPEPYTRWWLARYARLAGQRPSFWRLPSATALAGLFDPAPSEVDEELLSALGVRRDATVSDATDASDLLARLGDEARRPDAALTWRVHHELAEAVLAGRVEPEELDPPELLRASDGSVTDSGRAVLLDHSWLAVALPAEETVTGRVDAGGIEALARLCDLPLASEIVAARVLAEDQPPTDIAWAELPEVVSACAALDVDVPPGGLVLYPRLTVELTRPEQRRIDVPAWRQDGRWHAADPVRALLALLAVSFGESE